MRRPWILLSAVVMCLAFASSAWAQASPETIATEAAATSAQPGDGAERRSGLSDGDTSVTDAEQCPPETTSAPRDQKSFFEAIAPILILLVVIGLVFMRLPKVNLGHTKAFVRRRVMNWLPLGVTYALLYMGRYNLKVAKNAFELLPGPDGSLMGNADFGIIFMVGTITYGCSFIINGPLTDKIGGKRAMLLGAGGATVANLVLGLITFSVVNNGPGAEFFVKNFVLMFSLFYALNMYFQSFGAAAIVKVNAPWFHLTERGVFGAIFGILISLGIYLAFDVGDRVLASFGLAWVFLVPCIALTVFWVIDIFLVKDTPAKAGHKDFDTGDATEDGEPLPVKAVFIKMMTNPIIVTIALVEFCSGFLRQAIMQWYRTFAKQTDGALGLKSDFVYDNWGLLLCCAGIMGGVFAGVVSDRVFQSRRGPVAGLLYAMMVIGGIALALFHKSPAAGWIVIVMSMFVIGVHGMLSGTASMDFGGKKNVGVAVGIIDGFVYLGTGVMSLLYAFILPEVKVVEVCGKKLPTGPATDPSNWIGWPVSLIIVALIGTVLAFRLWNARARR